VIILDLALLFG